MRAARHYEGAEQILIRQAVMSSCHFVTVQPAELPPVGCWVQAVCPARLDLSGERFQPEWGRGDGKKEPGLTACLGRGLERHPPDHL